MVFRRFSHTHGAVREYVTGEIYGSGLRPDGTRIVTSALVRRDESSVVTSSGDRYVLDGDPDAVEESPPETDSTSCTR